MITDGNPQKAVDHLNQYAKKFGSDAETEFMLPAAYAQAGDLAAAKASMKKALDFGLPPGRFLAGPREFFKPLAGTPETPVPGRCEYESSRAV